MKKIILVLILSLALGAISVSAEDVDPVGPGGSAPLPPGGSAPVGPTIQYTLDNPFNCGGVSPCTLFTFLEMVISRIILPIGGILAVLAFIYSGFLYVTAQGDAKKITTAHHALLYTAIGTAVLLGAWVIAKVIENTINQLR